MEENKKVYTVKELIKELKNHDENEKVTVFFHNNSFKSGYGTTESVVYGARNFTLFFNSSVFFKDGKVGQLDIAPFVKDGQGYASLKTIEDIFDLKIIYISSKNVIIISISEEIITLELNSNLVLINGNREKRIKGRPILKKEKVFLPLEFIIELLKMDFEYNYNADGSINAIIIIN
ncbi:MAG: hypothetical protein GXW85_09865 [Clostridia bacterium]|nr:hypothetical protein [Clostridia bacterium]